MARLKSTITLLVAIFAIFASKNFIPTNHSLSFPTKYISDLGLAILQSTFSFSFSSSCNERLDRHHHHHHKRRSDDDDDDHRGKIVSVCDDFPPDFPPPDTDNTSTICVDKKGCCNFTSVQTAVDAVANFSMKRTIIWINSGLYYEKVIVPKNKQNVTFQGQGYTSTAIAWNDTALTANGTFTSASVQVFSNNFSAKNISFMNLAPIPRPGDVGAQAVAMRIGGDEALFLGCGFFGAQDTLLDDRGRHYFKNCYIQGSIDFIFGNGRSIYEGCELISIANPVALGSKSISGSVTAQGRFIKDDNTGFVFINCEIGGSGRIWLGRAWKPFSRVVFINTTMTDIIAPEGWNDFNDPTRDLSVFYGEYGCSGVGANMTLRPPYVQRLNDTQVLPFLNTSFIDGDQWLLQMLPSFS